MAQQLALAFILLSSLAIVLGTPGLDDWETFKQRHGIEFDSSDNEGHHRKNFEARSARIQQHNEEAEQGLNSYTQGLNKYSHLSPEEFGKMHGSKRANDVSSDSSPAIFTATRSTVPATVDWRTSGYVTGVKDQGQCGSCWSFSATGALEGQLFKSHGQLVSLSEQQFLDCETYDSACNGGWPGNAFYYVGRNKGLDTETFYPYRAKKGGCLYSTHYIGATCSSSYQSVASGDEVALQQAVATIGPISIAIQVTDNFEGYSSGVFYDNTCANATDLPNEINHAVLAVGYGTDPAGGDYWLVKNSWGTSWGEAGYIRMARNRNNTCGVALYGTYPTSVVYG